MENALTLKALKRVCNDSLNATAKILLGYKDITPQCHGDMLKALESDSLRKLIVMPRGTFKTSIASVAWPIWLLNRNPNLRILLDSELYTNSKNRVREIKSHMESEPLMSIFGQYKTRTWNESEIIIAQRTKILKEASITCSGIGAGKTGAHYDVIIADDLNSPLNSNTTEGCQKVIDHYRMYHALLEPNGVIAVIGTRYSDRDVIQFILENEIDDKKGLVHE